MSINQAGIDLVKHFEGLYLKAYLDPVGVLTIGYGHTGPDVKPGMVITEAEADALLKEDLAEHEDFVGDVVKVSIDDNQKAALTSFAFNVGNGSLKGSTLLRKLNDGDHAGAADEFLRWVYGTVNGVKTVFNGLVRRRKAERALFVSQPVSLPAARMEVSTGPGPAASTMPMSAGGTATSAGGDYDTEFAAFIQRLNLRHFKPYEFLVMGHQHTNPNSPAFGLNAKPHRNLWKNIADTARVLDSLRELMGAPIATLSVYRTEAYNKAIGGAKSSQHLDFNAVDFVVKSNSSPADWAETLRILRQDGFFKGGIGTYKTFVHIDTRGTNADW